MLIGSIVLGVLAMLFKVRSRSPLVCSSYILSVPFHMSKMYLSTWPRHMQCSKPRYFCARLHALTV